MNTGRDRHLLKEQTLWERMKFFFLENVLTDFEKCEKSAAFLDRCASDKRNNQIQNKLIKKYYKI